MRLAIAILFASCLVVVAAPALPIQHNPFTVTTNSPNVTVPVTQPVSITTTSNISLEAPSLIKTTNLVNGMLNVRSLGAVGDGVSNDAAAIQAAINLLPTGNAHTTVRGATLLLPAGNYYIGSNTLVLKPGIIVRGVGMNSTILNVDGGSGNAFELVSGAGYQQQVTISDLTINCDNTNKTGGAGIFLAATNGTSIRPEIKNVYILGTYYGIHGSNWLGGHIVNTEVDQCTSHGIVIERSMNDISWEAVYAQGCFGDGWRVQGNYLHFVNCSADNNHGYGFHGVFTTSGLTSSQFVSCGAEGNWGGAMRLEGSHTTTVQLYINPSTQTNSTANAIELIGGDTTSLNNCWAIGSESQSGSSIFGVMTNGVSTCAVRDGAGNPVNWFDTDSVGQTIKFKNQFRAKITALIGAPPTAFVTLDATPSQTFTNNFITTSQSGYTVYLGTDPSIPAISQIPAFTQIVGGSFEDWGLGIINDPNWVSWLSSDDRRTAHQFVVRTQEPALSTNLQTAGIRYTGASANGLVLDQANSAITPYAWWIQHRGATDGSAFPIVLNPLGGSVSINQMQPGFYSAFEVGDTDGGVLSVVDTRMRAYFFTNWLSMVNGMIGIGKDTPIETLDVLGHEGDPSLTNSVNHGIVRIGANTIDMDIGRAHSSPYAIWMQVRADDSDNAPYPLALNPLGGRVMIGTTNSDNRNVFEVHNGDGALFSVRDDDSSRVLGQLNANIVNSTNAFQANGVPGVASVIWTNVISGVITQQFICTGGIITSVTTLP